MSKINPQTILKLSAITLGVSVLSACQSVTTVDNNRAAVAVAEYSAQMTKAVGMSAPLGMSAPRMTDVSMMPVVVTPMAGEYTPEYRERYGELDKNPVQRVADAPVSTFSIDVDTGSYSNVRRMLNAGSLPPVGAVRIEELLNYFDYSYPRPNNGKPFKVTVSTTDSPWQADAKLIKIAIQAQDLAMSELPSANLVFLVDVSGSMNSSDKLPLVKSALRTLTEKLRPEDKVTIVTYASGETLALPATSGSDKAAILKVINSLQASGATAGEQAIQLAYKQAEASYIKGGINRILIATDGDFNVGITDFDTLKAMISEKRKSGISFSTLGFGTGNYNEALMEQLADVGDGNYSYIDNDKEAAKVVDRQLSSTLATVAQDVKIQVEFNPQTVKEYRLVGFENRMLQQEDFNNDKVDAGDIGAGHQVTAFYEIIPMGKTGWLDELRYADNRQNNTNAAINHQEYGYLKLRYKLPNSRTSQLIETPISQASTAFNQADNETRFAAAVATYGELLQGGKYAGRMTYADVAALASSAKGVDKHGLRAEFIELVKIADSLSVQPADASAK